MSILRFCEFVKSNEDTLVRVVTAGEYCIPMNIYIWDMILNESGNDPFEKGKLYDMDILAVSDDYELYESEADYRLHEKILDLPSLIPSGTFPADDDDDSFIQNPNVIFSGEIVQVKDSEDDKYNYDLIVKCLETEIELLIACDTEVKPGYIISGVAFLYAIYWDLLKQGD